jgi:hypothetical protein
MRRLVNKTDPTPFGDPQFTHIIDAVAWTVYRTDRQEWRVIKAVPGGLRHLPMLYEMTTDTAHQMVEHLLREAPKAVLDFLRTQAVVESGG